MTVISHGNILAVFFQASEDELQEGKAWYANAFDTAKAIASRYDLPGGIDTVAAVIAALSPNNRWNRNVRDAESLIRVYCAGGEIDALKVSSYGQNKAKAVRILKGEPPLDVLGGNKVRAFYRCIAGHTGLDVCIDGHAFSIWSGQRVTTSKTPSISDKLYAAIAEDYRRAAVVVSSVTGVCYSASEVQAITWVVWRNLFKGEMK
jgi:hypothetical protein